MNRLPQVREQLLTLHRALLAAERVGYERVHGRLSAGAFLEQVISAEEFAWLQPMTALIVGIDEALQATPSLPEPESARALETSYLADVKRLLVPNPEGTLFGRKYAEVLQASPEVVLAHGALMSALAALN